MAVAAAVTVFLGFARTYYLKYIFFPTPSFSFLFHVHGALFSAWMLLFVLQTSLAASRNVALHRRVGSIGPFLVVPMLVTGCLVSITAARGQGPMTAAVARGDVTLPGPLLPAVEVMAINLTTMLFFAAFANAGLFFQRRPDVHKRFMTLATIAILPSAIGRVTITLFGSPKPPLAFGATTFFLLALVIYDRRTRGRMHPVTLWAGLALLLSFPARLALAKTDLWHMVATWLIQ